MRAAFGGIDIIRVRKDKFIVSVGILKGYFTFKIGFCHFKIDDIFVNGLLITVDIFYKFFDSALIMECIRFLSFSALVGKGDFYSLV